MPTIKIVLLTLSLMVMSDDLKTPYEKGNGNQTASYFEAIAFYKKLERTYDEIRIKEFKGSDAGYPLHLVSIDFDKKFEKNKDKVHILINNGIHPGEPEGIDASMMLARDLLNNEELKTLAENIVVHIIPVYNIGGALNRSAYWRANQNGPEEGGFRGNAKNLDLNRDFIKCDSKNAKGFSRIFHFVNPHLFLDTHTSNGADYPYTMTLLSTQKDKLHPRLSKLMTDTIESALYKMSEEHKPMIPYVFSIQSIPDSGIAGFLETPRYSTGYTTLFNVIGFTLETHMLKEFKDRVDATYKFFEDLLYVAGQNKEAIAKARSDANKLVSTQKEFPLFWELDKDKYEMLNFKGYKAIYKTSEISGKDRLYYDQSAPWEKEIKYFNNFNISRSAVKPYTYVIPQAWHRVIKRFELNQIKLFRASEDMEISAEVYIIEDWKDRRRPYEGHYIHQNIKYRAEQRKQMIRKGDYIVYPDQIGNRYIMETLEPGAHDSFFAWNFFDAILQQKEWYSSYVFEDVASELLKKDKDLSNAFEEKKKNNPEFAKDASAQLYFIYKHSPYYEKAVHMKYPILRINTNTKIQTQIHEN